MDKPIETSDVVEFLTGYAKSMKKKGHSQITQLNGMQLIFAMILDEVYSK